MHCEDSLIFLVGYFGQTSILSNYDCLNIGIQEQEFDEIFNVYPDPVSARLFINRFPAHAAYSLSFRPVSYELLEILGEKLLNIPAEKKSN